MKTREESMQRQDEINAQLNKTNDDLAIKLDPDMEEQAIQVEQNEVASTMEANLRKELAEIEFDLAEMDQK